ncbi:MAG TPA: DVUA0089 family protein, partial [Candidatus Goldiibacteriota bacterium]|nr:DVUA0089 family protein [Candidatus Goldiibacteriota bacterium]
MGDTVMWLFGEAGVPVSHLYADDNSGPGDFSSISAVLPAGIYYVKVAESGADGTIGSYFIELDYTLNTPTPTPTFTRTPATGDIYEPDNTYLTAKYIYSGQTQVRDISPVGDTDWVKFDVTMPSVVILQTSGWNGDTEMWMYDSAGAATGSWFQYDDDGGGFAWSMISATLQPGTYYVRIADYANDSIITGYNLSMTVVPLSTPTPTISPAFSATMTGTITATATETQEASPTATRTATISLNEAVDNFTLMLETGGNALWQGRQDIWYFDNDAARSGGIGNNMQSYMRAWVQGPGIISFAWRVSSEPGADLLSLYDGAALISSISGESGWQEYSHTMTSGMHLIKWEYSKDGAGAAGADAGWVDRIEYVFMTATVTPYSSPSATPTYTPTSESTIAIPEAVDAHELSFTSFGANPWYGQASIFFADNDAARSGYSGNSQYSYMETNLAGPGSFSFYWKVSSQESSDYLRLYIDSVLTASISGEVDWTYAEYGLAAGNHVIRWMYSKDASGSAGLDAGFVDMIQHVQLTMTVT